MDTNDSLKNETECTTYTGSNISDKNECPYCYANGLQIEFNEHYADNEEEYRCKVCNRRFIRKALLFIIFVFSLYSCGNNNSTREIINIGNNIEYEIITIDGCEYILGWDNYPYNGGYFLTHKGNCKNPIHYQNIVTVTDTIEYRLIKQE